MHIKLQRYRVNYSRTPLSTVWHVFAFIAYLSLAACSQESSPKEEMPSIGTGDSQEIGQHSIVTLDSILGRWVLESVNGNPVVVDYDGEREVWVEFGPPCYESSDGHCNEAFDGGWEPSMRRSGRLSLRGYTGCNWFGSEAILEGWHLTAKPIISTERGCNNAALQESKIQEVLSGKSTVILLNEILDISNVKEDRIIAALSIP